MNQQISSPFEIVLIKEEIADNLQNGDILEREKSMEENDEFSALENHGNIIDNMQYSSSLCEEPHMENFLNRVKKETGFNIIHEEIQITDENLFKPTDSDSEDKSNNKLLNEGTNKPDYIFTSSKDGKIDGLKDQIVENARRYKCDKCQKTFDRPSHLQRHSRIHTGEKPNICNICHKKFKEINHLTAHERIHNNERPYKCSVCHNSFIQSSHLSHHMRTHTGEKPFHCQFCQYKCAQTGDLKRHMRIHTGKKPFMCMHCQKPLSFLRSLQRHMRTHHSDKI